MLPHNYYYVHHLNKEGADFFELYLSKNGIHYIKVSEYLDELKNNSIGFIKKPM